MKKLILILAIALTGALAANAQKFAMVDMDYILRFCQIGRASCRERV